jgi:hypothetical protein
VVFFLKVDRKIRSGTRSTPTSFSKPRIWIIRSTTARKHIVWKGACVFEQRFLAYFSYSENKGKRRHELPPPRLEPYIVLYTWGGVNRFSYRRISQKKIFGFRIWRIFYTDLRILLVQRIADLSNILARIVDLACNLVRILDCDFIVELLAGSNLDKTIVGSRILGGSGDLYTPIHPPPLPCMYRYTVLSA